MPQWRIRDGGALGAGEFGRPCTGDVGEGASAGWSREGGFDCSGVGDLFHSGASACSAAFPGEEEDKGEEGGEDYEAADCDAGDGTGGKG